MPKAGKNQSPSTSASSPVAPIALAFSYSTQGGLKKWIGDPSCQSGHESILAALNSHSAYFLSAPPKNSNAVKGNLGEFITLKIGSQFIFQKHRAFAANALNPLSEISRSEVDLIWIFFDKSPQNDLLIIQEVKTTGSPSLQLANELVDDYDKLFGLDPAFTIQTRLQALKNKFELELLEPQYIPRLNDLAGISPATSHKTRIVPTLVHEKDGANPDAKMALVRTTLVSKGWPTSSIDAWSISLSDIDSRLERIAQGQL